MTDQEKNEIAEKAQPGNPLKRWSPPKDFQELQELKEESIP